MVDKTEVDNEGIKKGLQQINLQLNETNKQLAEQGKPNLFKAFKENQAEVLASFAISKMQMKHADKIADAVSDDVGTVKTPRDAKGRAIARKPATGDTLYGLMTKLVTISGDQYNMFKKAKTDAEKKQEEFQRNQEKKDEEKLQIALKTNAEDRTLNQIVAVDAHADALNAKDVANEDRIQRMNDSHKFLESLRRGFTGLKNPSLAQAKISRDMKKLLGKGLLTRAKVLKRMIKQGKLAEGLGKSFKNFFSKDKKDKNEQAGLISKGLSKLGGIFKSGFNALKSTFGFLLKTAAALLTIGLIFKFLDSDYWKSIKPNIGQIIAQSVIVAENIVNMLITVVKDILIPALLTLAKATLYVAKKIGGIFGMQFAEGKRSKIEEDVRANAGNMSEAEIQTQISKEVGLAKMDFINERGGYDLGDFLLFRTPSEVIKKNNEDFKTMMSDSGVSLGGFEIIPTDMTSRMGNLNNATANIDNSSQRYSLISGKNTLVSNSAFRQLYLDHK